MHRPDTKSEKRNRIRLAYWETLIALRSGGVRGALVVFSLLLLIALVLGGVRTQDRQSNARMAEQENALVKKLFEDTLQGTSSGATETPTAPALSSRMIRLQKQLRMSANSPYLVSHATNLWDASLFPSPLSTLSVGASDSWPDRYPVRGISFSKTVQRFDQVRPAASVYGPFDATFVVMAIAPLIIIGLTFNISSRDRESGLQNLTVAQTRSLGKLMALRCFVRAALVIGLVICFVNGALIIAFWGQWSQFDLNIVANLVSWNVVTVLYLLFWAASSHFVNSFAKSSATNGAALLFIWLLLVMVIPEIVSQTVQRNVPTLPESQLVDLEKEAFEQASGNVDEQVNRFRAEHPGIEIDTDDEQQMALVNYLLAHNTVGRQAAEIVGSHYAANSLRSKYLEFCNWVSPAIAFRNQSDHSSGNSEQAFIAFSANAAKIQANVTSVFLKPSIANEQCTAKTIAALPSFQESGIPRRFSWLSSLQSIGSVVVWLAILFSLGTRQFRVNTLNKVRKQLPQESGVESA